jgi:hypothetical protein
MISRPTWLRNWVYHWLDRVLYPFSICVRAPFYVLNMFAELMNYRFYFCLRRCRRTRGTATGFWGRTRNAAPEELQTTTTGTAAEIQPVASQELYGYFAPPAGTKTTEPTPTAAQEVHGYYAPMVAPRMGDVIPARPAV